MSRLQEYNPEFGVVFDEIDDAINAALGGTSGGAGAPPPKPEQSRGPGPVPAGWTQGPTPGNIIRNDGFASQTWNPQTGQYEADKYPPSRDTLAAAGITKGSGGSASTSTPSSKPATASGGTTTRTGSSTYTPAPPRNYAAENAANKGNIQQQNGGVTQPPAHWVNYGGNMFFDPATGGKYQKDASTGVLVPWGVPTSLAERSMIANAMQQRNTGGTTTALPQMTQGGTTTSTPGASLITNALQGDKAPLLSSFSNFTTPGQQFNADNYKTMFTGQGLNQLNVNPGGQNLNGPHVPVAGNRAPSNLGVGPAVGANIHMFPGQASGTVPAYAEFPNTAFPVPKDYVPGPSGFNDKDYFSPVGIPFGITGTSPTTPGGGGTMTLQGPQNVTFAPTTQNGVSTGMGFVNSPFAANSIAAAYGRNVSSDAATGAVQTAQLLNAQAKYGPEGALALLTRPDPGIFSGQPGLYGNLPMEGNGQRTDYGWIFGGDSGGYEGRGDFSAYAGGGRVATGPLGNAQVTNEPIVGMGVNSHMPRFLLGEAGPEMMKITPMRAYADGGLVHADTPMQTGTASEPPKTSTDPLDPSIIEPWQQAAQRNAFQSHLRATVDEPRRRAGGLIAGSASALPVYQGDAPANNLPPGVFYDTSGQVNRGIENILNAQEAYRNLPAPIDTNPLYTREGELSTQLALFDRMRQLELQRTGAQATDAAAKANAQLEFNATIAKRQAAEFQQSVLENMFNTISPLYEANPNDPQLRQQYLEASAKLEAGRAALWGINTDLLQLQNRINAASPELTSIEATLGDLRNQTQGLSEGTLQTERGLIRSQLETNQSRMNREQELRNTINNLRGMRVPSLNQPIVPVAA